MTTQPVENDYLKQLLYLIDTRERKGDNTVYVFTKTLKSLIEEVQDSRKEKKEPCPSTK
jgi:hypothetical protein